MSNKKNFKRPKLQVRIIGFRRKEENSDTLKKVLVHATYWTDCPQENLKEVKIENKGNKVALTLSVEKVKVTKSLNEWMSVTFCKIFDEGFEFNKERRNQFEVSIGDRPDSTKKTVVIYEDADVIDDTMEPQPILSNAVL